MDEAPNIFTNITAPSPCLIFFFTISPQWTSSETPLFFGTSVHPTVPYISAARLAPSPSIKLATSLDTGACGITPRLLLISSDHPMSLIMTSNGSVMTHKRAIISSSPASRTVRILASVGRPADYTGYKPRPSKLVRIKRSLSIP